MSVKPGHAHYERVLDEDAVRQFRATGFLVLRGAFDPAPLSDEIDRSLSDGLRSPEAAIKFESVEVRYLPMMCERTPVSLSLLDAFAGPAAQLLGRPVLPMRAKGSRYIGDSAWHRDSDLDVPSIGFVAYLESLDGGNGALRVQPGSHRDASAELPSDVEGRGSIAHTETLETEAGDVIAFDEHLAHGSVGGEIRPQWRVDFVADPADDYEEALVRSYFSRLFQADWDCGYDVDRYPNYDPHWRKRGRPWTERLRELGAYDLADAQEDAVRAQRLA